MAPSLAASKVSLRELADLAIGTPEVGAVNFTALHTLIVAMLKSLNLQEVLIDFFSPSSEPGRPSDSLRTSLSVPHVATSKESRRSLTKLPPKTLESQVKDLGCQVQDLSKQIKNMDNKTEGIATHVEHISTAHASGLHEDSSKSEEEMVRLGPQVSQIKPVRSYEFREVLESKPSIPKMAPQVSQSKTLRSLKGAREPSPPKSLDLIHDIMEDMKVLKEAHQKVQESPELNPQELLQRINDLEKLVKDQNEYLDQLGRRLHFVPGEDVTMVTWEELEQAITDGWKASQGSSDTSTGTPGRHRMTSNDVFPSGAFTKHLSTDQSLDSPSGPEQTITGPSGAGQSSERVTSRDRIRSSTGFPSRDQHPWAHETPQVTAEKDRQRTREPVPSTHPRRDEQHPRPAPQALPPARDQRGRVAISQGQGYPRPGDHGLGAPGIDQPALVHPSTFPHTVVPISMGQLGVLPPGTYDQEVVPLGMDQRGVMPPLVPGREQQGLEPPTTDQLATVPFSTYQHGMILPGTDQQSMEQPVMNDSGLGAWPVGQQGLIPVGMDQHGFIMLGQDQQGLIPPGVDQQGLVMPGIDPWAFHPSLADPYGLVSPGLMQLSADQQGFGQPSLGASGFIQPGTEHYDFIQPEVGQYGLVQPGVYQPGLMPPGADRPGSVQTGAGQRGSAQPGTGQPGSAQAGAGQPGSAQPRTGQPDSAQAGAGWPGLAQAGAGRPGLAQPEVGQPGSAQAGAGRPGLAQRGAGWPGLTQRGAGRPGLAQSGVGQPGLAQAGADQRGFGQGATDQGLVSPGAGPPGLIQPGTYPPSLAQLGTDQHDLVQAGAGQQGLVQPGAAQPGVAPPGAAQQGVAPPGIYRRGPVQLGEDRHGRVQLGTEQPGLMEAGADQREFAQLGVDQHSMVQPGVDQRGLVKPGALPSGWVQPDAYSPGLVQPGVGQYGLVQPLADQYGFMQPSTDQFALMQPDRAQYGLLQSGIGQPGLVQSGADDSGLTQPGMGQCDLTQSSVEQRGLMQHGVDQHGLVQPGVDQRGLVQSGMEQHGSLKPGAEQPGLLQPGADQFGMVQPGIGQPSAEPRDLAHPGALVPGMAHPAVYPPRLFQPGAFPRDFFPPGAYPSGFRQPTARPRGFITPSTELRGFAELQTDSQSMRSPHPYQHSMVPPDQEKYDQRQARQSIMHPGIDQLGPRPLIPDQQQLTSPDPGQQGQIYPGAVRYAQVDAGLDYAGPAYPGDESGQRVSDASRRHGSIQFGFAAQTVPFQDYSRRRDSLSYLRQMSEREIHSERQESLEKLAPSFPMAVETFRLMGELIGLYSELKENIKDLDEDYAGQTDLEKIQYLLALMVKKTIPQDLQEQLKTLKTLTKEVRQDKAKLDKIQRLLDGEGQSSGKDMKSSQLSLQLGILRVTVSDIEKELSELRESQERGKAAMENSVCEASLYLQDQLDKLRTIMESMLTSSSTLLSMSMTPHKSTSALVPGQIDPEATCPACSLDVSHQVSLLVQRYEQLQDMVNNLAASRPSKKAKLQSQDEELLGHVQSAILQVQGDCEKLNITTSNLVEDHRQKQKDIEVLYQGLEKLEKEKADREHLEMEIDVKADKSALASKVSRIQFDATTEQLNHMMQELVAKMSGQEQDWQKLLDKLLAEMDSKLDRLELDPVKQMLEDRWKSLRQQLKERSPLYQADEAAAMRRQLLAHFHCLSCDRPLETPVTGQVIPVTPVGPGLPGHRSIRPYTVFELEQVRQQSRSLKLGGSFSRGDLSQMERSVGRFRTMYSKMLMDIEKVQIHFGGSVKASSQMIRELLQAKCLSHPCYKRGADSADYTYSTVPRRCGGSHTLTYPYRRNRLQHLSPLEEIQITMKHDEVDILGLDGHIYKGRMDMRLPGILAKETSGITKHKSKQLQQLQQAQQLQQQPRPHVHRQQSLSNSSLPSSRPQSAQMLANNNPVSSRQKKDQPVSSEGCLPQSNIASPSSPTDLASLQSSKQGLDLHMDIPPGRG